MIKQIGIRVFSNIVICLKKNKYTREINDGRHSFYFYSVFLKNLIIIYDNF